MRQHVLDGDACWCLPDLEILEEGGMIIVHRLDWRDRVRRVFRKRERRIT